MSDWPSVSLTNVQRMRVLAAAIPNAQIGEAVLDAPFERVWAWFSDLEHNIPAFDGEVRRLRILERDGEHLRIKAWQGPGAVVSLPFDVLLEPSGWCLMTAPARLYVVGMCADPIGTDRTHVALLEAIPLGVGRLAQRFLTRHVAGDVRRIARLLTRDT
jgi:hypothetical protein